MDYRYGSNEMLLSFLTAGVLLFLAITSENPIYFVLSAFMMLVAVVVRVNPRVFYVGLIAASFCLEMVYFNILGGTFRVAFFAV